MKIFFLLILLIASSVNASTFADVSGRIINERGNGIAYVSVSATHNNSYCAWIGANTFTSVFGYYSLSVDTECEIILITPVKKSYQFQPTAHVLVFLQPSEFPISNINFTGSLQE